MSTIFTFEKIYKAYLACRKTKRKTINALKFEYNLERNLFLLKKELETKTYKPGRSICFVVKNPSPREIFAASFRDRVVHHILIREIEKIGEKILIFDTFSCRKNKGTHLAVERLKMFMKIASSQAPRNDAFYLQLDISGFFMAINHNILYGIFEKMISQQKKPKQWKDDILWLAKVIIFHKPTENYIIKSQPSLFNLIPQRKSLFGAVQNKGLPIGNYSSQFFANLYLNKLDQFVKRDIGSRYYVRYVDDFILLGSKRVLAGLENKINGFLKGELDLELNLSKTKFLSISRGIEFLGYFIKPSYVLVKQNVVQRLKTRLATLNLLFPSVIASQQAKQSSRVIPAKAGIQCVCNNPGFPIKLGMTNTEKIASSQAPRNDEYLQNVLAMLNSYYGHFSHAFSFNLRKSIYEKGLGGGGLKANFCRLAAQTNCQITKK